MKGVKKLLRVAIKLHSGACVHCKLCHPSNIPVIRQTLWSVVLDHWLIELRLNARLKVGYFGISWILLRNKILASYNIRPGNRVAYSQRKRQRGNK